MPFLIIATIIIVLIVAIKFSNKNSSTKSHDSATQHNKLTQETTFEKKHYPLMSYQEIFDYLIPEVDRELGSELLKKKSVERIKLKIIATLEKDYNKDPLYISDYVHTVNPQLWAQKMIAEFTFITLGTKKYYGENGITPTGILYYNINKKCVTSAYELGYIEESEFKIAIRNLDEIVRCQGDKSLYRYHEVDNYLDNIW
jgi:hypothetical protein